MRSLAYKYPIASSPLRRSSHTQQFEAAELKNSFILLDTEERSQRDEREWLARGVPRLV